MRARVALGVLLAVTAALYLWDLSASGFANTYYAAAAQAGARSWSSWFFGSLDWQNFITVDKPPASLWVSGLSVRLFGLHSWSVLVPQALIGVAAVAVLYAAVRRSISDPGHGTNAGLLAGCALAATPAAALIFRFNNPDALLVLLLTTAAYCAIRAVDASSWRWLTITGAVVGLAFLTKMLQAVVVLPGFTLAYLLAAQVDWRRRLLHLTAGAAGLVATAGWWVLIVSMIPARSRPYIGGSRHNSVLDLALGYNGVGRVIGRAATVGGNVRAPGLDTGIGRLLSYEMGYEISWLLPAAVGAAIYGAHLAARRALDRNEQAALVIWGGWLVVAGAVLSYMTGTIHPYYTVVLAPPIAALCALAAVWAWRDRARLDARLVLLAFAMLIGWRSVILLRHSHFGPSWLPWATTAVAVALLARPRAGTALASAALLLSGSFAYAVATVATPHQGPAPVAVVPARLRTAGWMENAAVDPALTALLSAGHTRWSAAANGAQAAAALQLASGTPVMAVGGWSGDPVPTLQQFIDDVHAGRVGYYVQVGGAHRGKVARSANHSAAHTREISEWVAEHYSPMTFDNCQVYRLNS